MTVQAEKYRAPFTSERWVSRPYNSCRAVSLHHLRSFETLGESITWANGLPYGRPARVKQVEAIRDRMAQKRGTPASSADGFNRDEALFAYRVEFPDGNAVEANPTKDGLLAGLKAGYAYSLSGNVRDVPDYSPIDDAVNEVPHEIAVAPIQRADGRWLVYEPMAAKRIWAEFEQVWAFTKQFRTDGRAFGLRVKAGYATKAAKIARTCQERKAVLKQQRDRALDAQRTAETELQAAEDALEACEALLIACREQAPDCTQREAAARQTALDDAINALVDLQEAP
jgi:hypothetical protein